MFAYSQHIHDQMSAAVTVPRVAATSLSSTGAGLHKRKANELDGVSGALKGGDVQSGRDIAASAYQRDQSDPLMMTTSSSTENMTQAAAYPLNSAPGGPNSNSTTSFSRASRLTSVPPDAARIVDAARKLFEVRTMQEHWDLIHAVLAPDVAYQAPIISTNNRQDLRVVAYLAKSIAYMTMDPHFVEVLPVGPSRNILMVDGTVTVSPKRSWLVPPSLLLPDIPIRATIKLGVRGPLETGKIELIDGRWHNLPSLPGFVTGFTGLLMGSLMHWTEPLWARGLWLVGDDWNAPR